jgi:hypothetical protein
VTQLSPVYDCPAIPGEDCCCECHPEGNTAACEYCQPVEPEPAPAVAPAKLPACTTCKDGWVHEGDGIRLFCKCPLGVARKEEVNAGGADPCAVCGCDFDEEDEDIDNLSDSDDPETWAFVCGACTRKKYILDPKRENFRFAPAHHWLLGIEGLSPGAKCLYIVVMEFYNPQMGYAWPGHKKLAEKLGGQRLHTIIDWESELEDQKLLEVKRSRGHSNRYRPLRHPAQDGRTPWGKPRHKSRSKRNKSV